MLLRNKDRQILLEIFSGFKFPVEIWAYGSRVSGDAHDGSDLDLVIRTLNLEKLPNGILMEMKEKIRESNIPILVDIYDWDRLPESFHRNIINGGYEVFFTNIEIN